MNGGDNSEGSDEVISPEVERKLFGNKREVRTDYVWKRWIPSRNLTEG